MAMMSMGLNGDFHRLTGSNIPTHLDWNSDATITSGWGIANIQVAIFLADPQHDRLEIDPASGITLSNGFNAGSKVTIGNVVGEIGVGGSGTYNFHVMFEDEPPVPASIAQKSIRALMYKNTAPTLADDFSRKYMSQSPTMAATSPRISSTSRSGFRIMEEPSVAQAAVRAG